jgi:hypothetical protein
MKEGVALRNDGAFTIQNTIIGSPSCGGVATHSANSTVLKATHGRGKLEMVNADDWKWRNGSLTW